VVHAFHAGPEISALGFPEPAQDLAPYEGAAKALIDSAIGLVTPALRSAVPAVQTSAVPVGAAAALLDASADADLLVVGRRELRALPRLVGSVTHQCIHHAHCPVTVVPIDWRIATPTQVVVGVDGSETSERALRWALDEAAHHGAELVVAHAWNTPYPVEPWGFVVTPQDRDVFVRNAHTLIEKMMSEALARGAPAPRDWRSLPIEDAAGPALVRAAVDADLLVVGSRGRGGFGALLLGSTSLQCVHHATTPVTVVPRGWR
jgi:nucleotide-binding universal stress UspA family protein